MALDSQILLLPFASGLAQKTQEEWLDIGSQTTINNGVFFKKGAIEKRWGHTILATTTASGGALWGNTVGGEAVKIGGYENSLWQIGYAEDTDKAPLLFPFIVERGGWSTADRVSDCMAWRDPVVEWSRATNSYDSAYSNGYLVSVYASQDYSAASYSVHMTVTEVATGSVVVSNQLLSVAASNTPIVRCCQASDTSGNPMVMIVWIDTTAGTDLYGLQYRADTLVASSATKIINDFDNTADSAMWDICPVSSVTGAYAIVYPIPVTTTKLRQLSVTSGGVITTAASTTWAPPAAHTSPGHGYSIASTNGSNIWTGIIYDDGANSHTYVRAHVATTLVSALTNTDLGLTYTGTAKDRIAALTMPFSNGSEAVFVTSNRSSSVGTRWRTIDTSPTLGTIRRMYNYDVASKPFGANQTNFGTQVYCVLAYNANLVGFTQFPPVTLTNPQGTYQLVDLNPDSQFSSADSGRPVATLAPRIANTAPNSALWSSTIPTCASAIDSNNFITVGSVSTNTSTRFGLHSLTFSFEGDRWNNVELGGILYMAGGVPSAYDGQLVTEIGYLHPPPTVSATPSNTGPGAMTSLGVYTYYILYQWFDAKGNISRSASAVTSVTMGAADDTVTLGIENLSCTTKQDPENGFNPPVTIQIYRNQNGGSTFYQLQSDSAAIANDPQTYSQNYVDVASDVSLPTLGFTGAGFGQWPFAGGQVEGYCPGAMQKIVAYNQRLFAIGDDRRTLIFSTALVGGEQPRFSDEFRIAGPGIMTGLEVQDGVLYIWTQDAIYRLAGQGPNEQATQTDFGPPQIVSSAGGCIEPRSIVKTHMGILFQSANGIQILGRSGEPQYIGAAVEDYLLANPVITSATFLPHRTEVRFECQPTVASTTGVTLVYNFMFNAWSTFTRYDTDASLADAAAQSSVVVDDTFYWSTPAGAVFQENNDATATNAFTDNGHWVTLSVTSARAKAQGLDGWARWQYALVFCERVSPHDLIITIQTEQDQLETQTKTFTSTEMAQWTTELQEAEVQIGSQKSPYCQITIADAAPTGEPYGTGQGGTFLNLQIQTGIMKRRKPLPTRQSA